jgi:hypothetical protein
VTPRGASDRNVRQPETTQIVVSAEELALLRSALRYLESTLGREEAGELEEVQGLTSKLERAAREARG